MPFYSTEDPSLHCCWLDSGPLKMSINQALFPVPCVQSCRWAQIRRETILRSRWPVKLFALLDFMSHPRRSEEPLLASVCRGLGGGFCRQTILLQLVKWTAERTVIPSIKAPCLTLCLLSLILLVIKGQGALWLFAGSPVLFSVPLWGFFYPWGCRNLIFWGGGGDYDHILTSLFHSALRFGWRPALSALSRAHSHLLSPERTCTLLSLMAAVGRWMTLQAFVWQIEPVCDCTHVKEAVWKSLVTFL